MLQAADLTIRLNAADDVVIARAELPAGTEIIKEKVRAAVTIPAGHKIATRALKPGDPVRRYNQIIGFVTQPISPGDHVHVHNLAMGDFERDYAFSADYVPTEFVAEPATFMGIKRDDGRVATRNYLGVISSVNCSAHVCRLIAKHFDDDFMAQYPNVWVKVSELSSVSKSGQYPFADAYPYVKRVYEAFGPDRLLFGTGYPGSARAAYQRPTLDKEIELIHKEIPFFTPGDREKILGRNAARLWGFGGAG